jgi:hypothetical protein
MASAGLLQVARRVQWRSALISQSGPICQGDDGWRGQALGTLGIFIGFAMLIMWLVTGWVAGACGWRAESL